MQLQGKCIITLVCFLITFIYLARLSIIDIKYREVKSLKIPLCMLIPSFIGGYCIYGCSLQMLFGFCCLLIPFFLLAWFSNSKDKIVIGGLDIFTAPLITIWFGFLSFIPLLFFLVGMIVCRNKKIAQYLDNKCEIQENVKGGGFTPLIPLMFFGLIAGVISVIVLMIIV